ncbi:[FeFe] hydrogenase H-cluster maturation GTPase HydF [Anaerosporomusa subterranea]|uniref:[FeFe] hydrogenase H-cluster maturation GTPase HydF n=1 Tax=Anaerosporomusa subterranea TaxID=1794912 RepID=A0A154BP23_ANASB|nr:[FeFe] hydrogenase H-cluster maturation GTPase HydF [Anaerosporomusa subterranea]KYZ75724.1 [FeFe] hydrogenase H-cluster maturation GTPase HydF [Anaerosporomusa subterranea]
MQETPKGDRLHIALFGRRNAGKSSMINALTGQDIALVSDVAGTTTDPVYKAMELLPVGPVMFIDTAGIDDVGELGALRVERTMQVLNKTDLALLVIDPATGVGDEEIALAAVVRERKIPLLAVINKADVSSAPLLDLTQWGKTLDCPIIVTSAVSGLGIEKLKQAIIQAAPDDWEGQPLIGDLLQPGDTVVMVVPIDLAAPKGRLILPQVQAIRDALDNDAICIVAKERELRSVIDNMKRPPRLVVTDSQEFLKVSADTPPDVWLTSFSILMARHKGDLSTLAAGAKAIDDLKPGDSVLVAEGCTHHRQADDIGRVKIPRWLRQRVGGDLDFTWVSGGDFPTDLSRYKLIIHCGSCMLNRRQMVYRLSVAREQNIPIVNYGVLIAWLHGILPRALRPFPLVASLFTDEQP